MKMKYNINMNIFSEISDFHSFEFNFKPDGKCLNKWLQPFTSGILYYKVVT